MIKHFIITAFRIIRKQRLYALINIMGLSISLAAAFLILLYITHELSYNKSHKNRRNIYRIIESLEGNGEVKNYQLTELPLGPKIQKQFPEIELQCRIANYGRIYYDGVTINLNNQDVKIEDFLMVDQSFFKIFSFQTQDVNIRTLFNTKNSVLISKDIAMKLFGQKKDLIGKKIEVKNNYGSSSFFIAGIFNDISTSTIKASIIGNIDYFIDQLKGYNFIPRGETYILTHPNTDILSLGQKINKLIENTNQSVNNTYNLQAFTDIYFHSWHIDSYFESLKGNIKNIYIFAVIAIALIIAASTNYILMSIANAITRTKEIGVRKTLGASRKQLFTQGCIESLTIIIIAFFTAIVLSEIFLPEANRIFAKELKINYSKNWQFVIGMVLTISFITLISTIYTSFYLSKFEAIKILKDQTLKTKQKAISQKILIALEITILIILLLCTNIIYKQIQFAQNKDLGFNRKNLVKIPMISNDKYLEKNEMFLNEIQQNPNIISASSSYGLLSKFDIMHIKVSTSSNLQGKKDIGYVGCRPGFIKTSGIQLIQGNDFFSIADSLSLILNETAVKELKLKNPLKESLRINDKIYNIVGVVKDFNIKSIHSKIPAMIIGNERTMIDIFVRIKGENTQETINFIEEKWNEIIKKFGINFEYHFIDETFTNQYKTELHFSKTVQVLSILSIIIAFLGLFGLSSFLAKQKTKEIAIRKVFGASVYLIIKNVSKSLLKLTIIANIIAWPISWYLMDVWLQNFAYSIKMPYTLFITTGLLTIVFVFAIQILNAYKVANANPVNTLYHE